MDGRVTRNLPARFRRKTIRIFRQAAGRCQGTGRGLDWMMAPMVAQSVNGMRSTQRPALRPPLAGPAAAPPPPLLDHEVPLEMGHARATPDPAGTQARHHLRDCFSAQGKLPEHEKWHRLKGAALPRLRYRTAQSRPPVRFQSTGHGVSQFGEGVPRLCAYPTDGLKAVPTVALAESVCAALQLAVRNSPLESEFISTETSSLQEQIRRPQPNLAHGGLCVGTK